MMEDYSDWFRCNLLSREQLKAREMIEQMAMIPINSDSLPLNLRFLISIPGIRNLFNELPQFSYLYAKPNGLNEPDKFVGKFKGDADIYFMDTQPKGHIGEYIEKNLEVIRKR